MRAAVCRYDRICKVEPFQRALLAQECDMMINGRRRDHGAERAHLHLFDMGVTGVGNCQVCCCALRLRVRPALL